MNEAFRGQVESLPDQVREAPRRRGDVLPGRGRLILAAMGGSAMATEFLSFLAPADRETVVVRDDALPGWVGSDDALLAVSYSGETTETLGAWREAGGRGMPRAAVASGGSLLAEAQRKNEAWVQVPAGLAPRSSLGYLLRAGAELTGWAPAVPWSDLAAHLETVRARWSPGGSEAEAAGPALAAVLHGRLPVLLALEARLDLVARRWAADLAENAKVASVVWPLPEASHNAVMALAEGAPRPVPLAPVIVGRAREERAGRRWRALREVLVDAGAELVGVDEPHRDRWVEAVGLAYVGDWVSLHLADRQGVDAADLSLMDEVKRRLRQGGGTKGETK